MKVCCLLAILLLHNIGFSQIESNWGRCDSILFVDDSSRVVLFKKSKAIVYDCQSNKRLCKPIKQPFVYLNEQEAFVQFSRDEIKLVYVPTGKKVVTISTASVNDVSIEFPLVISDQYDSLVLFNGSYLNYKNGLPVKNASVCKKFYTESQLDIDTHENDLIVVHYSAYPLEGENNFDQDILLSRGFARSGVFDGKSKKWIVPQDYLSCCIVGSNIVCVKRDTVFYEMSLDGFHGTVKTDYSFDQFRLEGGEAYKVASGILSAEEFNVKYLFDIDSLENVGEDIFRSYKNQKQGLIRLSLTEKESSLPSFQYTSLLEEKYSLIIWNEKYEIGITHSLSDTFSTISVWENGELVDYPFSQNDLEKYIYVNWNEGEDIQLGTIKSFEKNISSKQDVLISDFPMSFGIEKFNDSLLLVYNQQEPILSDYPLVDEYGYDVVEYDGQEEVFVYDVIEEGYQNTGVFNLNSKNWVFSPAYAQVYPYPGGFLCEKRIGRNEFKFDFYNLRGEMKFQNYSEELQRADVIKLMFDADTVFNAAGTYAHTRNKNGDSRNKGQRQYILRNDQYYWYEKETKGSSFLTPKDFLYKTEQVIFSAANDSLYLEVEDTVFAVDQKYGWLSAEIVDQDREKKIAVTIREKYELSNVYYFPCSSCSHDGEKFKTTIEAVNEDLIINTENEIVGVGSFEEDMLELGACEELVGHNLVNYQTESSSIWRKIDGVWQKMTPYYASIYSIEFGFLVSTGEYYRIDCEFSQEMTEEKRYIVLDKNFKPISYYDYYDFEEAIFRNGLILKTAQGSFFVNEEGRVITANKWDDFRFENGKLKAIRYAVGDLGEKLYDQEEEVKLFEYK